MPNPGNPPVAGSTGKYGTIAFTAPKGWKIQPYQGGVDIMPADITKGEFLDITFLPSKKFTGLLSKALAESWEDACRQFNVEKTRTVDNMPYDILTEKKSFKGWDYIRAHGSVRGNGGDFYLHLFIVRINNRIERIVIVSKENRDNLTDYHSYNNPKYNQVIQEFLFSIQFDDWKDPELSNGSLTGNEIAGAWNGISMFGGKLNTSYAIFFSNGQVFFGSRFQLHGLDGINTWIEAEITPRYWGTYQFKNGSGMIKMSHEEIPVFKQGNDIILKTNNTDHRFIRLPSVDGAILNGNYVFSEWDGKIPSISFKPDGRFEDKGALFITEHVTNFPVRMTDHFGSGKYEIKNFTVIFNYDDGRQFKAAFPGQGYDKSNPSPPTLTIGWNDDTMKKQ
jgi:hypothetical protein